MCCVLWMFCVTGHGKNACDGIDGLVKHQATLYNLRLPAIESIQSASSFVDMPAGKLKNVFILQLENSKLAEFHEKKGEWENTEKVPEIQSFHM